MKARLEEAGIRFPKTHDLNALMHQLLSIEPLWSTLQAGLLRLNRFAVRFRYPGDAASAHQAKEALRDARAVREQARAALGL